MHSMDQPLIPYVVSAPPLPVPAHLAPPAPTQQDIEVAPALFVESCIYLTVNSDAIGHKRYLTSSLIQRLA